MHPRMRAEWTVHPIAPNIKYECSGVKNLQVAQYIIMNHTQCQTLSRLQELQVRGALLR